jgi:hypothetical protein
MRNITKEIVAKWLKEQKLSDGKGKFPGEYPTRIWIKIPKKFEYFGKPSRQAGKVLMFIRQNYIAVEFDRNGIVYSAVSKVGCKESKLIRLNTWEKYHPGIVYDPYFSWLQYAQHRNSFYRNEIYGRRKVGFDGI